MRSPSPFCGPTNNCIATSERNWVKILEMLLQGPEKSTKAIQTYNRANHKYMQ